MGISRSSEIATAVRDTSTYLWMALRALCFWRRPPPLLTVADLVAYCETRAKFVAQTSLYGYIKTRAGTRYVSLMEDDTFVRSVNIAKWEIFLACLCDMATYAAVRAGAQDLAAPDDVRALAVYIVETALADEETPPERPKGFDDVVAAYRARTGVIDWSGELSGEAAFHNSLAALVEWAPIADELKINDVEIVKNSMRFRWKKVRDQFETLLDADAVLADWRRISSPADGPA